METQFAIDHKINEAEACRSMRLFSDSLRIYEDLLKSVPPPNSDVYERVQGRIRLIQQEIRDQKRRRVKEVADDELDSLIKQLPDQDDARMIFDKALALSKKIKKSVEFVLIEQLQVKKEAVGRSFSLFYDCPFREYDQAYPVPVELLAKLKKAFLLNEFWVPLSWDKDRIEILVDNPRNLNKTDNIKALMKTNKINFCVGIREDIQEYIKLFFDADQTIVTDPNEDIIDDFEFPDVGFEEVEDDEVESEEADEASGQVVRLVDQVIIAAYRKNASDIHIEPSVGSKTATIRFRLDGLCQEYIRVPNHMVRGIVSRIKIMSNLDIAERRQPQDGKIRFRRKGVPAFELRVATIPVAGEYEDVILRILASAGAMQIDEMGLSVRNLEVMKRIINSPYGLILAVGPTGSGKTTSLHSLLGHINKPDKKIWTAEDPIEITQPGLRQSEVKPKIGVDFARLMRAFLRGDPDVIMIGEMRDEETASIGIEASLTGHLVFSTLHTNSAPETITRLLDMGLNPLNFSDAFLGVLAQRLTRRLCINDLAYGRANRPSSNIRIPNII